MLNPFESLKHSEHNQFQGLGPLNHVAIAVPDLQSSACLYAQCFGFEPSQVQDLPEHGVSVVFLELPNCKLELISPLGTESSISKFIQANPNGGIHHVCFDVESLGQAMAKLKANGARILGDGRPKIGAHGKPVVFLHPKDFNGVLIELEEVS